MVFGFCPNTPYQCEVMIIWAEVSCKELLRLGKEYPWRRPPGCPDCGGGLWGHGFVRRYLACAPEGCWLKRYRCPHCGKIICLRPRGYWPRFWQDEMTIRSALQERQDRRRWRKGFCRQVGGHWRQGLARQVKKYLGLAVELFPSGFVGLIVSGWVPVSRSKTGVPIPQRC